MLCEGLMTPVTVGPPQPGDPMTRRLDHLVICVHDLAQAALDWQTLDTVLIPSATSHGLALEFVGQETVNG
jgi:hypothetical protein